MSAPHAVVVGAGIAGLASAIALRRAGWTVELVERAPALEPLGAALSLWPNAMDALRRLGAAEPVEAEAAPIRRMLLETREGTPLLDRAVRDAYLPTRAGLQRALSKTLGDAPLRLGCEAVALASAERGEVLLAQGDRLSADLLVAADGIWSPIGRAVTGGEPRHCGYQGVVTLSDPTPDADSDGVAAEFWGRHERWGLFDLGGGRRYWFHMRTAEAGAGTPGQAELMERARQWPAGVAKAVAATPPERLIPWPIHAKPPPRRLVEGRVVCVGDAGHAMEPNLGQGACQALEDAVALGVAAASVPPDRVPAVFERMRLARVRLLVRRSAEGRHGAHGVTPVRALMRAGLRLTPRAVQERMVAGAQRLPDYGAVAAGWRPDPTRE